MTRTTEQAAIDDLISELIKVRYATHSHSSELNALAVARAASHALVDMAEIANVEAGIEFKRDVEAMAEPIVDGVNDLFFDLSKRSIETTRTNPNDEHKLTAFEYGLESA
jgi:hypothetical protein